MKARSLVIPEGEYIVAPIFKAIKVLEYVAESGREVSLTEVAHSLGLPKTTVFRYLQTLSATSFLHHIVSKDRYEIGTQFRAMAGADRSLHRLRTVALPVMRELSRNFNETINLAIETDGEMVYIEIIESTRALRMQARIGSTDAMHTTALGKAFLAYIGEAECAAFLARGLAVKTFKSVVNKRALLKQLDEVRLRGYALDAGENEDGAVCIGVPILNDLGFPIAALSMSVPERRESEALVERGSKALKAAGLTISQHFIAGEGA